MIWVLVAVGPWKVCQNSGSHINVSHSQQTLVKGERWVRCEVNAVVVYLHWCLVVFAISNGWELLSDSFCLLVQHDYPAKPQPCMCGLCAMQLACIVAAWSVMFGSVYATVFPSCCFAKGDSEAYRHSCGFWKRLLSQSQNDYFPFGLDEHLVKKTISMILLEDVCINKSMASCSVWCDCYIRLDFLLR